MKVAWFTADGHGLPIAYKLECEGNEVYVGQVRDWKEIKLPFKEEPEEHKARLERYDGLLRNKWPAQKLISFLHGQPTGRRKDWVVICDFNFLWPIADQLRRAGYIGLFPHKEDYELEKDRKKAHDLISDIYPDVETGEYHEFHTPQDGIKFLHEDDEHLYVLKGFNIDAETIVPLSNDIEDNREILTDALERDRDNHYGKDGYILEEKIEDAIEFTPEAVSFNGEVRSVSVDIEHKRLGARSGPMTGCAMQAILWQEKDSLLYDMFLAPLESRMLREGEITFWDLSVFFSPSRKKFYAGEFCPNRMGYDAVFGEICTYPSVTAWLAYILGSETEREPLSASMRIFNLDKKRKLFIGDPADPHVWCFDVHEDEGKLYTTGYDKNAFVITADGDNLEYAISELYDIEEDIEFDPGYFLSERDWYDKAWHENILHRLEILTKLGLIEPIGDKYATTEKINTASGANAGGSADGDSGY